MISSSCYHNFLCLFLFTNICTSYVSSSPPLASTTAASYSDHCASVVPESIPTVRAYKNAIPLLVTNHYTGGDRILGRIPSQRPSAYVTKSLKLKTIQNYYTTNSKDIFKVEAYLYIRSPYRYPSSGPSSITFLLNGFWSDFSRKLCMVGSAPWPSDENKTLNLDVVLKLKFPNKNPTIFTSFISGVLESTSSANDSGYFDPLSIFGFPVLSDYSYSLALKDLHGGFFGENDVPKNNSLDLQPSKFCSMLTGRYLVFELEYATECKSLENCNPLGKSYGYLPQFMSLDLIQCLEDEQKVRYIVKFQNITRGVFYEEFDVDWTMIGEGSWYEKKNQLHMVACRIGKNAVEDCTIRLSLRYPSIWTIRNDAKIVGQIWTNKTVNDSGYFRRINLSSSDENDMVVFPGLRYEYTELNRVKKLCPVKTLVKKERNIYPDGHSLDMKYDISVRNYKGKVFAWGDVMPLSVGKDFYQKQPVIDMGSISKPEKKKVALLNMNYKIGIRPFRRVKYGDWFPTLDWSINLRSRVEITAEGVYDVETGHLCMLGCRKLLSYNLKSTNHSTTDCEILVKFEFAPLNERRGSGLIKGSIKSMREKVDPLYFEDLSLLSAAFYRSGAKKSISRMDLEIILVLISSTFVCIFVGLQLIHVKRNPEVLPCISLVMLVILCLGHMIPLVLNYEALFSRTRKTPTVDSGGRIELGTIEVIVRVVTMVALLLIMRLLQLVWTARSSDRNEKGSSCGEKKAGLISLLMYMVTTLTIVRIGKYSLMSCFGLVLDGFLLPQMLLNIFRNSEEKALTAPFYIGISVVRLVPHGYDTYRARNYPSSYVKGTHYYANPAGDVYSPAWDVVIPWGVVMLVVVITLQQWFGGRCIVPGRFEVYEKVPEVNNEG
ncbi:hypothetical protein BUALT_Bualt03G0136500 [Buddleja alternifolia]|uniref:RING-type E3 ubiquitin transferase n=1 Tax=Buddleja alternifolia TaxID=168488 RepID=A0AAV6Y4B9_9LAMI|nr:hypothetical protein BUALT_Bualt03G0136500 [Buddleja alternifolia]